MPAPWILLLLAIGSEVIGTSCLKLSEGFSKPIPTLVVLVSYATAMLLLSRVVQTIPLGITYAYGVESGSSPSCWLACLPTSKCPLQVSWWESPRLQPG